MNGRTCWIGTDESGKGDYFGPLVIAGVSVNKNQINRLKELGVKDSKKLSDNKIKELSKIIKKEFINSLVTISPEKYNKLWGRMKNLNRILAWGHARVIENILQLTYCDRAISDKFGDEKFIERALMKKGKQIIIEQKEKAEEDLAVAAASILARAQFLNEMEKISSEIGVELKKGSSQEVKEIAKKLIEEKGTEVLDRIAKKHFRITKTLLLNEKNSY
ncbi:MAG: ribonuclease HIII [Acidobacteriota bacterium]